MGEGGGLVDRECLKMYDIMKTWKRRQSLYFISLIPEVCVHKAYVQHSHYFLPSAAHYVSKRRTTLSLRVRADVAFNM